ncbi:MAG TPA: histidine kinase [Sphingobacteriaceae bacterium]|nr:histidine kinase [Sphingobacteriaceae bacterium]
MATSLLSTNRFRFLFALTAIIWALMQAGIVYWFGYDLTISAVDGGVSAALLALACILTSNIFRFYQPKESRYLYIAAPGIILAAIFTWAGNYALKNIFSDDAGYAVFLNGSIPIRFCFAFLVFAWMALLSVLWYTQQEQQENEQRKSDAEKLAKEAELYNLRQQLQPHFLFNSLNSITALIGSRPEEARKMIHQLSDFLRGTINKDQQPVSLADELDHLQLYLDIEKVRFGHRLETRVEANDTCRSLMLPPMLLQPIVENAIKFGLYDTTGAVIILVTAECIDNELCIHIQNPFDSETTRPKHGTGFGLSGVKRRLYLLFARTDLLQTAADNHIFTTTVKIPQT